MEAEETVNAGVLLIPEELDWAEAPETIIEWKISPTPIVITVPAGSPTLLEHYFPKITVTRGGIRYETRIGPRWRFVTEKEVEK